MRRTVQFKHLAGFLCVVTGGAAFTIWGFLLEQRSPIAMSDLYPVYYHARILMEHEDPYVERAAPYTRLQAEGFLDSKNIAVYGMPVIPCVYPPSSLIVLSPLALLRWGPAHLVWMALIAVCLTFSALLVWSAASEQSPLLAAALITFVLVNSATLLFEGNSAGIAVGLCMISAWCFIGQKQPILAIIGLAISLALKPHDSAFVWICFLLGGGVYRKRALQTLISCAFLVLVATLWVSHVSPHWLQEMGSNIASISARGGVNDPGPDSGTNLIVNSAINAQTIFAVIQDEPGFYNAASYILCGILFVLWVMATQRSQAASPNVWVSLAFLSALSMLPVYHRHHDAKLLILAVPGCMLIWEKRRVAGSIAVFVTTVAMVFNADIPRAILTHLEANIGFSSTTFSGKMTTILLARPAPLALIAMSAFFLWACWRIDLHAPPSRALGDANGVLTAAKS